MALVKKDLEQIRTIVSSEIKSSEKRLTIKISTVETNLRDEISRAFIDINRRIDRLHPEDAINA